MEQIKDLMKSIIKCVSAQTANMDNADTKELSEAMDMIKDLAKNEKFNELLFLFFSIFVMFLGTNFSN